MTDRDIPGKFPILLVAFSCFASCLLFSCRSTEQNKTEEDIQFITTENQFTDKNVLTCLFAGDIMAHRPNWSHGRFNEIYSAISQDLKQADLSFANIETPVSKSNEYSTYPYFNVHGEYVEAAINAGFNVFSLANNHSNDQELIGIKETRDYFADKVSKSQETENPIYAAGLKQTESGPYSYQIIEKNGWKVLFVAITEILNRPVAYKWIDYVAPGPKSRENFKEAMKKLREENPCDMFVISIHCAEDEYVRTVKNSQKKYYMELLDCGVDVIWANHPHVSRSWDLIQNEENGTSKMIFYSLGNTISAQRYSPSFQNPAEDRDYTGDGYIIKVIFDKTENGIAVRQISPMMITTFIDNSGMYLIKKLSDEQISEMKETGFKTWGKYLEKRKTYMEEIKGNLIWQ